MPISVKAFFNKYLLTPAHGINFGPCLFNAKKTATFEITNQGPFEIQYRLFSLKDGLPVDTPPIVDEKDKKGAKKPPPKKGDKNATQQELVIGKFAIGPSSGALPPRPPAVHQKRRGLGGSPRGGWTGGWRRLPKRLGGGYCRLKLAL